MEYENCIWGLDISTSIIGLSGVDSNGNLIFYDHIDLRKQKGFFNKMSQTESILKEHWALGRLKSGRIFIEEPFTFFRGGGSSAKTMANLQKFNGTVSWVIYSETGIVPDYVSPALARKLCGIKVPRGEKAKKIVVDYLKHHEPKFKLEYTRAGNPKTYYYDMADAIIVARAGQKIIQNEA